MYPANATRRTKVCTSCRREKDIDAFHFKNRLTGQRHSRCIACMSRSNQPREVAPLPLTKTCTKCLIEKPVEEFPFKDTERGKRHGVCKQCAAKRSKDAYYSNHERELERAANGKRSRRDIARQYVSEYLSTHPCVDCGQTNPLTLEFDHRGDKEAHVSELVHNGASIEQLAYEISKCDVRCANCHRRKTANEGGWFKRLSG